MHSHHPSFEGDVFQEACPKSLRVLDLVVQGQQLERSVVRDGAERGRPNLQPQFILNYIFLKEKID